MSAFPIVVMSASRRGSSMSTVTEASSASPKVKPMGTEGMIAALMKAETSVVSKLKGIGVSFVLGKPLTPLLAMSVSSTRMVELSGTWRIRK